MFDPIYDPHKNPNEDKPVQRQSMPPKTGGFREINLNEKSDPVSQPPENNSKPPEDGIIKRTAQAAGRVAKDIGMTAAIAPDLTLELAKGTGVDFPAHLGSSIFHGIKSQFAKGEVSAVTGERYEYSHIEKRDMMVKGVDNFMRQLDRGWRTIRHPIRTIKEGSPPERHERLEQALQIAGWVFEQPRKHVFEPLGESYGKLVNNAVAGQLAIEAMDAIFWVLGPYYATKAGGRYRAKQHAKADAQIKAGIESAYQQDLNIHRSQLVERLRQQKDKQSLTEAQAEIARKEHLKAKEYEARQKMLEDAFNDPNVKQFLDDVNDFAARKEAGKEGPVTKAEVQLLQDRWMERMRDNDLTFRRDYENWQKQKLELDSQGIKPANDWFDFTQVEIGVPGKGLPPGKSDLRFGVEAGRPYPKSVTPDPLIIPGDRPPRLKRETLGHKKDLTLKQKIAGKKKKSSSKQSELVEHFDRNQAGTQLDHLQDMGRTLESAKLPSEPDAPKAAKPKEVKPEDVTVDAVRELDSIQRTGETTDGRTVKPADGPEFKLSAKDQGKVSTSEPKIKKHGLSSWRVNIESNPKTFGQILKRKNEWRAQVRDSATGDIKEHAGVWKTRKEAVAELKDRLIQDRFGTLDQPVSAAPKSRLDMLREAAAKREIPTKELSPEAKARQAAQREADAYHGTWDDVQPPKSPFRESLSDSNIRTAREMWEDFKTLNKDGERGSLSNKPLSPDQANAANRLLKDIQNIARSAAHDGKRIGQWLLDNQWTLDPQVAQAIQSQVEGISTDHFRFEPSNVSVKPGQVKPGAVSDMYINMLDAKPSSIQKAKGVYGEVQRAVMSSDPDVRFYLEADPNPYAQRVYHGKIRTLGALSEAAMYLSEVESRIYAPLSRQSKKALDVLVRLRTEKAIYERHPGRKLPQEIKKAGIETVDQYLANIDADIQGFQKKFGLSDADAMKVKQSVNDWFGVARDLLDMKHKSGAFPDWLYNLLEQYDYAPTVWLEVVERAAMMNESGVALDMTRPPKTLSELKAVTDKPEIVSKRLSIENTGVKRITHTTGKTVEMNSQQLIAGLIAHTYNWVYSNQATARLGKYAEHGTKPAGVEAAVVPAKVKGASKLPKGGSPKVRRLDKNTRVVEMPDNPGASATLVKSKVDGKTVWSGEVKTRKGDVVKLEEFKTYKDAFGKARQELLTDVYGNATFVEAPAYTKPPSGKKALHYFEDGVQKQVWVDEWFHSQWNASSAVMKPMWSNLLRTGSGSSLVRYFATGSGNPLFFTSSLPMDWMHLYTSNMRKMPDGSYKSVYSSHLPVYSAQLLGDIKNVFSDVILKKGRYREYFKDGGAFPFLTQSVSEPVRPRGKVARGWKHFNDFLGYLNRTSEILVRLAHRERLIKQGVEPWEASIMARDRLDYAQGGSFVKTADMIIPYANAAAQSMRGPARAMQKNPVETGYKMASLAMTAASLYMIKRQFFPDLLNQESSHMEVGYWTIPTGATTTNEFGEKIHHMIRMRKDPTQTVITTAAQLSMAAAMGDEVRFNQLVLSLMDVTPLLQKAPLPPAVKALNAYITGMDPLTGEQAYRGPDVKPTDEWTQAHVSKLYKDFASNIGMSPDRFKLMTEQLLTNKNLPVEAITSAYSHIFDNVEEEQWSEMVMDYFTETAAPKAILYSVRPGPTVEKRERMIESSLEENAIKHHQNQKLDRLLKGYYLTGTVEGDEVFNYIDTQAQEHGEQTGERLYDRLELFNELLNLPSEDRGFWLSMQARGYTTKGRAQAIADEWISADSDRRHRLMMGLEMLADSGHSMIPKRKRGSDFWNEFEKSIANTIYEGR